MKPDQILRAFDLATQRLSTSETRQCAELHAFFSYLGHFLADSADTALSDKESYALFLKYEAFHQALSEATKIRISPGEEVFTLSARIILFRALQLSQSAKTFFLEDSSQKMEHTHDDSIYDYATGQINSEKGPIRLTKTENMIFSIFLARKNEMLGRDDFHIDGENICDSEVSLHNHINRIRKKLENHSCRIRLLHIRPNTYILQTEE